MQVLIYRNVGFDFLCHCVVMGGRKHALKALAFHIPLEFQERVKTKSVAWPRGTEENFFNGEFNVNSCQLSLNSIWQISGVCSLLLALCYSPSLLLRLYT